MLHPEPSMGDSSQHSGCRQQMASSSQLLPGLPETSHPSLYPSQSPHPMTGCAGEISLLISPHGDSSENHSHSQLLVGLAEATVGVRL